MKYVVEINGALHKVDVDGATATISDGVDAATLSRGNATPVRIMLAML